MSDWQVGDKALCIKSGRLTREGVVYTILHVWLPGEFRDVGPNPYSYALLSFVEIGLIWWSGSDENRFRKILPDKHEACEDEFAILLKLSKQRTKEGANAACGGTALVGLRPEPVFPVSAIRRPSTFAGVRA